MMEIIFEPNNFQKFLQEQKFCRDIQEMSSNSFCRSQMYTWNSGKTCLDFFEGNLLPTYQNDLLLLLQFFCLVFVDIFLFCIHLGSVATKQGFLPQFIFFGSKQNRKQNFAIFALLASAFTLISWASSALTFSCSAIFWAWKSMALSISSRRSKTVCKYKKSVLI